MENSRKKAIEREWMSAEKWPDSLRRTSSSSNEQIFNSDETYVMHSFKLVQIVQIHCFELRLQTLQLRQYNFK